MQTRGFTRVLEKQAVHFLRSYTRYYTRVFVSHLQTLTLASLSNCHDCSSDYLYVCSSNVPARPGLMPDMQSVNMFFWGVFFPNGTNVQTKWVGMSMHCLKCHSNDSQHCHLTDETENLGLKFFFSKTFLYLRDKSVACCCRKIVSNLPPQS